MVENNVEILMKWKISIGFTQLFLYKWMEMIIMMQNNYGMLKQ